MPEILKPRVITGSSYLARLHLVQNCLRQLRPNNPHTNPKIVVQEMRRCRQWVLIRVLNLLSLEWSLQLRVNLAAELVDLLLKHISRASQ